MVEKKELAVTEEKVVEIEMERLRSFENHPFKVKADSQMIELQKKKKKYGILNPLIVRPRKVVPMKSYQGTEENLLLRRLDIGKCQ